MYRNACEGRVVQHRAEHSTLGAFVLALRQLERGLGEAAQHDFWRTFLAPLKRYRFERCAAPLPFNHAGAAYAERFGQLRHGLRHCDQLYPRYAEPARQLLGDAEVLTFLDQNPLAEAVRTLNTYSNDKRTALLLKEPRFVTEVEALLATRYDLRHLTVVTPPQLKTDVLFDTLVVIGPMRWYRDHEYVFTAPRAPILHVVRYGFLGDGWEAKPVFTGNGARAVSQPPPTDQPRSERTATANVIENMIEAEEVLPTLDWRQFADRAAGWARSSDPHDLVPARLCLLEGEHAVFLDAADGGSVLTLDLGEGREGEGVRRVKVSDLEPEMFVVLRTAGGGDYVRPLADKLLGGQADALREGQDRWKKLLRNALERRGTTAVSHSLRTYGAKTASEMNVRNWASARTIRPRHAEDFAAVMQLVGLGDDRKRYWSNAQKLGSAHQRAGQHIRKLLLEKVSRTDLGRLEQLGSLSFELPESQGGSMTAFRVQRVEDAPLDIPFSQLGKVFTEEALAWPE